MRQEDYIIGVDGGGSKTTAVLANLEGLILARYQAGSSHPRNIGTKEALENVVLVIKKILPQKGRIISAFLGLPAMEEEFKNRKSFIKKELLKHKEISPVLKGKVIIGSDQLAGFRSGTNEKNGIVLIAGSGCVAHGWKNKNEAKVDGWGHLSEMGSGFWIGQKALQAIWKELDGRGPKTLITELVFRKLKIKNKGNLIKKIYLKNSFKIITLFSSLVDLAAKKGDKIAKKILIKAGKELALSANTAIKRLNLKNKKFPLVLIGSVFKSKIVLETVKKEIKKFSPKVEFIRPKVEPVIGAVKLALAEVSPHLAPCLGLQDSAIEEIQHGDIKS